MEIMLLLMLAVWELLIWTIEITVVLVSWTFKLMAVLFDLLVWAGVGLAALLGVGVVAGASGVSAIRQRRRR